MLKTALDEHVHLQKHLFEKGFLITDAPITNTGRYPFYGNWNACVKGNYTVMNHAGAKAYFADTAKGTFFLIGHACNPFTMVYDEHDILAGLAEAYGTDRYQEAIDELTGVFVLGVIAGERIEVQLDASGMQYGCYGHVNGHLYITSHMRLIGDLTDVPTDPFVEKLIHYRWYPYMMGNYLPGDATCYVEVKRIIPNTEVTYSDGAFSINRFYPNRPIAMCESEEEYGEVIQEAARIMQNTMALTPKKWKRPAISLTGGIDSNTTFAAANGVYDQYTAFSYVAMHRESVDAEKAKEIAGHFGMPHTTYVIPEENGAIENFDVYKQIFAYNGGAIGPVKDNDTRKKITLIQSDVCDVEVKSWISETIRAYAYKYYARKKFPKKLKPRHYTSLYKLFGFNRKLVWETDARFAEYVKKTDLREHLYNYDESDFFVWEMMHGGKCGLDIGVMKSCMDITIPYNNRKLLDLLLRVPLEKRISDQHHMDLKKLMNRELYDMNIRVVNLNQPQSRARMLNVYFTVNSLLPF